MSYSRKEREAFKGCDQGNQCHKEVLRVLKHMRGNHPTLRKIFAQFALVYFHRKAINDQ